MEFLNSKAVAAAFFLIALLACIFACPAVADSACDRGGCLRVEVRNELGQPVKGASVQLRLPGDDGRLMEGLDFVMNRTDGVSKGSDADGDKGKADADVEFDIRSLVNTLADGSDMLITVTAPHAGLANWSTTTKYVDAAPIVISSENKFMLRVNIIDDNGKAVRGLAAKCAGFTVTDGDKADADGKSDGVVFFAAALPAGKCDLQIIDPKTEAAMFEQGGLTIGSAAQTIATAAVKTPHQGD